MKTPFILLFSFVTILCSSQSDTLNKYNEKGKKHGFWEQKLDTFLIPTKSGKFSFIGYERYDNGQVLFEFENVDWKKSGRMEFELDSNYSKSTKVLSGTIKYKSKAGVVISTEKYVNGYPVLIESYYLDQNNNQVEKEVIDFSKQYNKEIYSWRYESIRNDKVIESGWFRKGKNGWRIYYEKDSLHPLKYPYIKNYTPPLLALQLGYDFFQTNQIELGALINFSDNYDIKTGSFIGPSLSYKRILDTKTNTIGLGFGFYLPLSLGFDFNYNFNESNHVFGFKPFIGTMLYNIQLLYGYNLFKNKNNNSLNLNHHSLTVRIAIPIKVFKHYLD